MTGSVSIGDMSELEPDPRSLLVFNVVVEEGSMSAAARRLGWTHPAISQHMQRLERAAGTALLIRYGRGVRPTAAGVELAAATAVLAGAQSAAAVTLRRLGEAGSAVVRVVAFPTACATFLVDTVSAVAPVRVQLQQAEPEAAMAMLAEQKADLAVVFDDEPSAVQLERIPLFDDELVLVVPEVHVLAAMPKVSPTQLSEYTVVAGCVPLDPPLIRRISVCRRAGRSATEDVARVLQEICAQVT
ncbi:LysR family transcriptional regulator [Kribbella yunnanensis]|uniref:LysR family transcriptional regulator n=2 Tax=Kribbella yunnanensis TaxID=190194 RepID=A0ABN2IDP1_9ACTN